MQVKLRKRERDNFDDTAALPVWPHLDSVPGPMVGARRFHTAAAPHSLLGENAMMFFRATGDTRRELERAFHQYAEADGRDLAVEAPERSTGARDVRSVPEHEKAFAPMRDNSQ
jgi:hypothetical protein